MFRMIKDLPAFKNMSATGGVTVVLDLPRGEIFDAIKIALTNITHANCTDIKYIINNRVIQEYASGTLLQLINDWYARPTDTGFLTLYFERPEMVELLEQVTSIPTLGLQSHRLEITLAAGLTDAAITAQAVTRVGRNAAERSRLGYITKVVKIPYQFAAGLNQLTQEITRGDPIMALHVHATDLTAISIIADSSVIFEGLKTEYDELASDWGRAPDAALASFDFCLNGQHNTALITAQFADNGNPLVQNLIWQLTKTGAAQANIYVEYLRNTALRGL